MSKKIKKRLKYYNREVFWHDTFDEICSLMMKERKYKVLVDFDDAEISYDNIAVILQDIKNNSKNQEVIEVTNGNNYIENFTIRYRTQNARRDVCILMKNIFDKKTKTPYLLVTKYWSIGKDVPNKPIDINRYMKK